MRALVWGIAGLLAFVTTASSPIEKLKIKTADKKVVSQFRFGEAGKISIERGDNKDKGQRWHGHWTKDNKREYQNAQGELLARIKVSDNGFKLRTPQDTLLWKVSARDDTIKIADNEEKKRAYKLKYKDKSRIKVSRDNVFLGEVRFNAEKGKVKIRDAKDNDLFECRCPRNFAAFAVLLCGDVSDDHKALLMSELFLGGF